MSLLEEIHSYCAEKKIRLGEKRVFVANHLLESAELLDGDTLWRNLRTNGIRISPATVYDSLNWLVNAGFAERQLIGHKSLFGIKERFRGGN